MWGITGYPTQSFMPKQSRQEKEKGINQKDLYIYGRLHLGPWL